MNVLCMNCGRPADFGRACPCASVSWSKTVADRIRELEAAVAERDEAVKVLAEHMAAREKHETGPTVHTLHVLNVACVTVEENPTASAALVAARAAVDAAKGGTK